MAAATGIWNHEAAGQAFPSVTAKENSAGNTGSGSNSDSATISANDFLTLLVTEMQNQDPTANTDPNEYINQLVNVNSLEQLISINQTLATAMGGSSSTTPTAGVSGTGTSAKSVSGSGAGSPAVAVEKGAAPGQSRGRNLTLDGSAVRHVPGNVSIPDANLAAERVAKSLGGHRQSS